MEDGQDEARHDALQQPDDPGLPGSRDHGPADRFRLDSAAVGLDGSEFYNCVALESREVELTGTIVQYLSADLTTGKGGYTRYFDSCTQSEPISDFQAQDARLDRAR